MGKLTSALAKPLAVCKNFTANRENSVASKCATEFFFATSLFGAPRSEQRELWGKKTSLRLWRKLHFARLREHLCLAPHKISKGITTPKLGGGDEGRTYKASAVSFQADFAFGGNQGGALSSLR